MNKVHTYLNKCLVFNNDINTIISSFDDRLYLTIYESKIFDKYTLSDAIKHIKSLKLHFNDVFEYCLNRSLIDGKDPIIIKDFDLLTKELLDIYKKYLIDMIDYYEYINDITMYQYEFLTYYHQIRKKNLKRRLCLMNEINRINVFMN
jgi:hypothetical protein